MTIKNLALALISLFIITACTKPEEVTEQFVKAMATGKCDEALKMSVGQAQDAVRGALVAGCETYSSEIIGKVTCEVTGDEAICSCTEKRALPGVSDITFEYHLKKDGSDWKITSYTKDNKLSTSTEK